jgi:hypothetical protein
VFVRPAEDKELARALRRQGRSVRAIAEEVGAARSTISLWVRDIPLDEAQQAALDAANPAISQRRLGQLAWSRMNREARTAAQEDGRRRAREGRPLHLAGCMLYWAEGSKNRNQVIFTNSDVAMVQLFVRFLRECFGVTNEAMALSVTHMYPQGSREPGVAFVASQAPAVDLRHRAPDGRVDVRGPEHLRCDPGVLRVRAAGVGRLTGAQTLRVAPPSTSRLVPVM